MAPGSEPIQERILQDVVTALQLADGDATGSEYFFEIGSNQVHRAEVSETQIGAGPYPLIEVADVASEALTGTEAGNDTYWNEDMRIQVTAWPGDSSSNLDLYLRRLEHDIRKALWTDYTRGGLALHTLWERTDIYHPLIEEDKAFVAVFFVIRYEVKLSDLTSTIP